MSAEEGRGVTGGGGEGFVGLCFFFFLSFCNTSCSGECLALWMLSGSGNYCGLRSLVIRCYGRRPGSAEPELFMQPSWSSQASRLGRASNGATGGAWGCRERSRAMGASSQPGHGVPTCTGLSGWWWVAAEPPWMAWEGLRGVRRAGARRAPAMRGWGILRAPCERADVCPPPSPESSSCITYTYTGTRASILLELLMRPGCRMLPEH